MCTAISHTDVDFYFGRTLDFDVRFGEEIVITPRNVPLQFHCTPALSHHFALLGMAAVAENPRTGRNDPLYFEAINEHGLAIAGLNFTDNAFYRATANKPIALAPYELPLFLLGQCKSVEQAEKLLSSLCLVALPFSAQLPLAQTHFLLADREQSLVIEPTRDGLQQYDAPIGVLSNNPPFPQQMAKLQDFRSLSSEQPEDRFCSTVKLPAYSRGMGALGLPGDVSSSSRFVRAAFTKCNSVCGGTEVERVNQFFHVLGTVEQVRGVCRIAEDRFEFTQYTSCYNATRGVLYYKTYESSQVHAVCLHRADPEGNRLLRFPLVRHEKILFQN